MICFRIIYLFATSCFIKVVSAIFPIILIAAFCIDNRIYFPIGILQIAGTLAAKVAWIYEACCNDAQGCFLSDKIIGAQFCIAENILISHIGHLLKYGIYFFS